MKQPNEAAYYIRDWVLEHETIIIQTVVIVIAWLISSAILNEFRNRRLINACITKNFNIYKRWVRLGGNLNYESGKDGIRPLMIACKEGQMDMIHDMIDKNPKSVHDHDYNGKTPVLYAIENGNIEIIKYLIDHKARVDDPSDDGVSPLIAATKIGRLDMVEYLLSKGASVKWKTVGGDTALLAAIDPEVTTNSNCLPIVKLLVKLKAIVDVKSKTGRTPLMQACGMGDLELVKYLLSLYADIKAVDENKESCFLSACRYGRFEVVKYLISAKHDDIDMKDYQRSLIYACVGANASVVKKLISSKRCDINCKAEIDDDLSVLMIALNLESDDIANILLEQTSSIDIHATATNGWNALFWAAENGHAKVVERLISMDIDVFHVDNEGWTALMIATRSDEIDAVNMILSSTSCDAEKVNMIQSDGWTSLCIAVALDHQAIAQALINHHADINIRIDPIAVFSEMKNSLHKRMKSIKCIGDTSTPLIMLAALCEHIEILDMLCKAGADINCKTRQGYDVYDVIRRSKKKKEMLEVLAKYDDNHAKKSSFMLSWMGR